MLSSPLWLQILSDALGHQVEALDAEAEASARGAAICALEAIGTLSSLRPPDREIARVRVYVPDPSTTAAYVRGRGQQERLESAIQGLRNQPSST